MLMGNLCKYLFLVINLNYEFMKTNKILLLLFISTLFTSCFSDKGNYEYSPVNQIVVEFTSDKYIISPEETVEIIPKLSYTDDAISIVSEVEYEWILDGKVVSNDPTYKFVAGTELGDFEGNLKVRNIATGEQYAGRFDVSVESPYKNGFLILYEDEIAQGEFGFIRSIISTQRIAYDSYDTLLFINEYPAIYEKANGFPMLRNSVSFSEHSSSATSSSGSINPTEITLYTGNGTSVEDINGSTFARETKIQDEFVGGNVPAGFVPTKVVHSEWDSYVLTDKGLIYPRRSSDNDAYHTGNFFESFTYNDGAKYSGIFFTDYIGGETLLALELDKDGKRNYVGIYCSDHRPDRYNGMRRVIIAGDNEGDAEKLKYMRDIKGEIVASDYVNSRILNNEMGQSMLVKEDGKYYIHLMFLDAASTTELIIQKNIILEVSELNGSKEVLGMSTSKLKTHVYFWDESKVYVYDFDTDELSVLFDSPTRRISAFGAHTRIKYYKEGSEDGSSIDAYFALGFESGEVEIYEFLRPDLTGVSNEGRAVYKSKNNYGKIKQIDYKSGKTSDFLMR